MSEQYTFEPRQELEHDLPNGFVPVVYAPPFPNGKRVAVKIAVPDSEHHDAEFRRLSHLATKGEQFSEPHIDSGSGLTIRERRLALPQLSSIIMQEIFEIHDAHETPETSLLQIQTHQLPRAEGNFAGTAPVKIMAYDVRKDHMTIVQMDNANPENYEADIRSELEVRARVGGNEPRPDDWINFYMLLVTGAREKIYRPPISGAELLIAQLSPHKTTWF